MTQTSSASLAVAERQLTQLGELAAMAMAVSRAFTSSALASAKAEEMILADEHFVPEVGRARACGAKDAAESFQKASRAMRLTLKLELAVAEIVDALREGRPMPAKDAAETPAILQGAAELDPRRLAGSSCEVEARDRDSNDSDRERLCEFDSPDRLPRGSFRDVVDQLRAEIGVVPNCESYDAGRSSPRYEPLQTKPPGRSECRPPDFMSPQDRDTPEYADAPLLESVTPPQTPP